MRRAAGSRVLAERYARALLSVVLDQNVDPGSVDRELTESAGLFTREPRLADVLSKPTLALEKRVAVLDRVLEDQRLSRPTVNLLRLLTTNERISILDEIARQYGKLLLEHKQIQPGEVVSAHPLTDEQRKRLAESLGKALRKTMELSYQTDEELLGGLIVRIGNRVFDASVVTQLRRFKEKALTSL